MYLSIHLSTLSRRISNFVYTNVSFCLYIYISIVISITLYLTIYLSISCSKHLCNLIHINIRISLSLYLSIYLTHTSCKLSVFFIFLRTISILIPILCTRPVLFSFLHWLNHRLRREKIIKRRKMEEKETLNTVNMSSLSFDHTSNAKNLSRREY